MLIRDVYQHYQIPPNLQTHMLQVAAVGVWICEHWQDKAQIDEEVVRQTLLLHDMGNILKFDWEVWKNLLGTEADRLEHWQQVQAKFKSKYGPDEHVATREIAKELEVSQRILESLSAMGYSKLEACVSGSDYIAKICTYSDLRVAPHGLVSVRERLEDGAKRYHHRLGNSFKDDHKRDMRICRELEGQIQKQVAKDLSLLSQEYVGKQVMVLVNYEL